MFKAPAPAGVAPRSQPCARGFSMLEMLISMAVLLVVTGAVFEQIIAMQRKSAAEGAKVDTSQQAREFVDQMVRDLHMAGYPKASMYSVAPDNTNPLVAAGVVSVSPTQIILEGDINSDGSVESVNVSYLPNSPGDPNCPCIRRSSMPKAAADPLAQPVSPNYTETANIIPPGSGAGLAGEDLFVFYDRNGNQIDVSGGADISTEAGKAVLASIGTVKINVSLLSSEVGAGPGETARTDLSATARLDQ